MNDELQREIERLLQSGQKLAAIKKYREETGTGLAEAKSAVESLAQGKPIVDDVDALESGISEEVVSLLCRGDKVGAVRLYRQRTGVNLKAAKEAVDKIAEKNGMISLAGGGCFGMILVAVTVTSAFIICT